MYMYCISERLKTVINYLLLGAERLDFDFLIFALGHSQVLLQITLKITHSKMKQDQVGRNTPQDTISISTSEYI